MGDVYWSLHEWCYHSDIQMMDKIRVVETLDNIKIKLFVLAVL